MPERKDEQQRSDLTVGLVGGALVLFGAIGLAALLGQCLGTR